MDVTGWDVRDIGLVIDGTDDGWWYGMLQYR